MTNPGELLPFRGSHFIYEYFFRGKWRTASAHGMTQEAADDTAIIRYGFGHKIRRAGSNVLIYDKSARNPRVPVVPSPKE